MPLVLTIIILIAFVTLCFIIVNFLILGSVPSSVSGLNSTSL